METIVAARRRPDDDATGGMVGAEGFEPPTYAL
jgi:hypothetical protein